MLRWTIAFGTLILLLSVAVGIVVQLQYSPNPFDPIIPEWVIKTGVGLSIFALPAAFYACLGPGSRSSKGDPQRAKWRYLLPLVFGLGFVTFASVMMSHDMQRSIEMLRQLLDEGTVTPLISRQWHGGDIGNVMFGTLFFMLLWLFPTELIRIFAAPRNAIWGIAGLTAFTSLLVLMIAVASFTMIYVNTMDASNVSTWPSLRSALFAMSVLAPTVVAVVAVILVAQRRSNPRLQFTDGTHDG